jgi:hypothetical protein
VSAPLNFDRWTTIRSVQIKKKMKITFIDYRPWCTLPAACTGPKNEEKCEEYEEKRRQFDTRALNLTHRFIKISVKKKRVKNQTMRDLDEGYQRALEVTNQMNSEKKRGRQGVAFEIRNYHPRRRKTMRDSYKLQQRRWPQTRQQQSPKHTLTHGLKSAHLHVRRLCVFH